MTLDLFERFRENLERFPDTVALQSISDAGRESFSYRRVAEEVRKIGSFLHHSGVRPGDSVGILMENHPRWGIAFLAAQSAGAVIVPLDVLHQAETLAKLIQHAECKFLIVSRQFLSAFRQIERLLPEPVPALVCGEAVEGQTDWETLLRNTDASVSLPLVPRSLDEGLIIIYTSGTTGNPKGVVLTQRSVYRNVAEILQVIRASPEDHFLSVLPLYHVLALIINFVIPLCLGARVTFLQILEAQRVLKTFREEEITIFVCVPQFYYLVHRRIFQEVERQGPLRRFMFRRLLAFSRFANRRLGWNPGRLFFSAIHERFGPRFRLLGVGGARFDREIAECFRDLGFNVVQAYGMTETAALITVAPPIAEAVGTAGRPLPHVEIRIDEPDEDGIGEVLIRGENVMKEYWKNPEATAQALRNGWLHSGDLGYIDARGWLHITGRKKDIIVLSSGKNVYPEEVEHFYQSNCPLIKEMCVVGVPDPDSGEGEEKLHAVIVPDFDCLKSRRIVNAYDAIRWETETLSQSLPAYQRVRSIEIRRAPLPRTTTRKLKRFQIQRELSEGAATAQEPAAVEATEPQTPAERKIFALVREMKGIRVIHRAMNLELDVGFTSLERVEFLFNVQQFFGTQLPEEETAEIFTVQDVISAVEKRLAGEAIEEEGMRVTWSDLFKTPLHPDDERKLRETLAPRPAIEFAYYLSAKSLHIFLRLLFRLKFEGRENFPEHYPFLICPNHLSYLDAFFLLSGLPYRILKRLFFLGDSAIFGGPITSVIARLGKVIPINPDRGPQLSLRLAAEGLRRGLVLCVFPEGERSIDGALKTFRRGPAIIATELGVPVVPVRISGAYEVWPRGSNRIRRHPVSVTLGAPLRPRSGEEPYDAFNQRLFEAVQTLRG